MKPPTLTAVLAAALLDLVSCSLRGQTLTLISATPSGVPGNGTSGMASCSDDGQWVAFESSATNLLQPDNNGNLSDVLLRDMQTQQIVTVSVGPSGAQSNVTVGWTSISADSSVIVFESPSTNLLPGVPSTFTNECFAYIRVPGQLQFASISTAGVVASQNSDSPKVSRNGRYVGFTSMAPNLVPNDTNGFLDSFVRDLLTGTTSRVSVTYAGQEGNGSSYEPQMTTTGRCVAFTSNATNLVPNDTNGAGDVFLRDLITNQITRVSVSASGQQANGGSGMRYASRANISDDARYICFTSDASNLVPNDTNQKHDVFRKDTWTGAIERANVSTAGLQGTYTSPYSNVIESTMSSDGRFIVFSTDDTNLVPGDTNGSPDVFLRDTFLGMTTLVSKTPQGTSGNSWSSDPMISGNGCYIAFSSFASNLTSPPLSIGDPQAYLFDRQDTFGRTTFLGGGCNGASGLIPSLSCQYPVLGATATLSGKYVQPNQVGAIYMSGQATTPLQAWPGCLVHLDLNYLTQLAVVQSDANGDWTLSAAVPNQQALKGVEVVLQAAFLTATPGVYAVTDAVKATLGS